MIGYNQIAIVFPFFVAGGRFFSGAIPLGGLTQIASAFGQVQTSLSWFVNTYNTLANWKASVDRLLTFHRALEETAADQARHDALDVQRDDERTVRAEHLDLVLPNGRVILANTGFTIAPGERIVVSGPSGSGKSTLFRALAGIWPFGRGRVRFPGNARVLFLPQKPYIPIGNLRDAVAYPGAAAEFGDDAIRGALADVGLDALADRLDDRQNWSLQLSGGEQQRLAIARTLLHRPDWLFLDEATASLDEASERHLYGLLRATAADGDHREHRASPDGRGLPPPALQPRAGRGADAVGDGLGRSVGDADAELVRLGRVAVLDLTRRRYPYVQDLAAELDRDPGERVVAVEHDPILRDVGHGVDHAILLAAGNAFELHPDRELGGEVRAQLDPEQALVVLAERFLRLEAERELLAGPLARERALERRQDVVVSPVEVLDGRIGPLDQVAPQVGELELEAHDRVAGDLHQESFLTSPRTSAT